MSDVQILMLLVFILMLQVGALSVQINEIKTKLNIGNNISEKDCDDNNI